MPWYIKEVTAQISFRDPLALFGKERTTGTVLHFAEVTKPDQMSVLLLYFDIKLFR